MDPRNDIREFLASRRARITPEQAELAVYGANRRVKGLRREEVAMLAGISAEYYVRLERGNLRGVSEDVLDGIARALQLDEVERLHLRDLAHAANATPSRRSSGRTAPERVRPVVQRLLDSFVAVPALVTNRHLDVVAANSLGEAFFSPLFDDPVGRSTTVGSGSSTREPRTSTRSGNHGGRHRRHPPPDRGRTRPLQQAPDRPHR